MANIRRDLIKGFFWSAVEKYSGLAVSIVISMVLARMLSPEEYGVVAIATVIIQFLSMFATMGIGPAIIQRRDLSEDDLNNIFSFSVGVGFLLSIALFFLSQYIAFFFDSAILLPVCQILSVNLFFSAINMVPNALMAKNKKFKQIAIRTLLLQLISGSTSIFVAYKGGGVYSLLISPVFVSIGIFFFNRFFYPLKISRHISLDPIKRIFSFSAYQFLFEFFNYFSRNLDKLIIGKALSASELGYYEKSYRLMQLPLNNITSVINPVLQPVLSQIQDDKGLIAENHNKMIAIIAAISFPLGAFLYVAADEIIYLMYGSNWGKAVPVFKILSLSIPLQLILSTSGAIFQSCNATKNLFYVGVKNTFKTVMAFVIASYFWGTIESIAWGWTIASFLNFFETYTNMYSKIFQTSLLKLLSNFLQPLLCFFALILGGFFVSKVNVNSLGIILTLKALFAFFIVAIGLKANKNFSLSLLRQRK